MTDTKHTDNLEECPFHSGAYFLDCRCNHTDSVEAIMKEFERRMPLITSHGLLLEARLTPTNYQKMKDWLQEKLTTLQATQSQQVEEAVRKALQGVYDRGLPDIEQIKESARGWGKEGSDRYKGYLQGANDVNGLVVWEICSHGIPLDFRKDVTPNHQD